MAKNFAKNTVKDYAGGEEGGANQSGIIVGGMHDGKHYDSLNEDQQHEQAASDADTLKQHAQIHGHAPRLKAAMQHLHGQKQAINTAHSHARRSLYNKTGQRLKDVFGEFGDESEGE